jgi:hypothetical protein
VKNAYGAALVLTVVLPARAGVARAADLESALGVEELTGAHVAPAPGAPIVGQVCRS